MIINDYRRLIYPLGLALELKIINIAPPKIHDGGAGFQKCYITIDNIRIVTRCRRVINLP